MNTGNKNKAKTVHEGRNPALNTESSKRIEGLRVKPATTGEFNGSRVKPAETKKKKSSFSYILGGKVLTEDFVVKQSGLFLLIFCLIILFISNRYYCSKKLSEMDKLKKELIELNYEHVFLTTRITAVSRQSQIEELLRGKGIELTKNNVTIYQIRK